MLPNSRLILVGLMTFLQLTTCYGLEPYTGIYSTFPLFENLPHTLSEALGEGYSLLKKCKSWKDEYGNIYSKYSSKFLPGLIYNVHGHLSGMVFAVNQSILMSPDEVSTAA